MDNVEIIREDTRDCRFGDILPREFFEDRYGDLCVKFDNNPLDYNAVDFDGVLFSRSFNLDDLVHPVKVKIYVTERR